MLKKRKIGWNLISRLHRVVNVGNSQRLKKDAK